MNDETMLKASFPATLLIVDDIPANVGILFDFLSDAGFKVLVAQDGKRALQKAVYAKPDLILLDIMMPGMDGFETCRILKSQPSTQNIPIIFMTALADTIDKVKGFSLGAADYITKPIQSEEVLARINAQLNFRSLQQQLHARTVELEKRNHALETFARTVAHDLKNPLNAIVGYTDILLSECQLQKPATPEWINNLKIVSQTGFKMVSIIDALLFLARVSKQEDVEVEWLDMAAVLNQIINQRLEQMIKQYHAEVILPETWPIAVGYLPWVEEVWVNYLSNGLKYGGRPPRLELGSTIEEDGMIRFWVHDNGYGLSRSAQEQLFRPFTRLQRNIEEGHGLGLSIVQQIIDKLGGQVGIESEEGQGSTFFFTLPPPPPLFKETETEAM